MATSTVLTNKPINPRGDDNRPVDSYNKASLYSGKALDFDGVNDYVNLEGFTMSGNNYSFSFYLKADAWNNFDYIFDIYSNRFIIASQPANNLAIYDGSSWQQFGEIYDTTNTNFFTITIEGTTSKAYLNGVQFGSTLAISSRDFSLATKCVLMGAHDLTGLFFPGAMSGFKAFDVALTAAQVADLYNNPEKIVPTGVADSALKLWLPMMEGAGTTAINGAPDALQDEEVTNGDFTTDSDWTKGTGWSISGGLASSDGSQSAISGLTSATIIGLNNKGSLLLEVVVNSVTSGTLYATLQGTGGLDIVDIASAGTYKVLCKTVDAGAQITLGASADFIGSVSSVSLKELANCGSISGATWTHGIGSPVAQTSVIDWNKGNYLNAGGTITEILVPQGLTAGRDLLGNLFENVRKQGALNLDGKSWAEVHDNASLDFGTGEFTLEAWVRAKYENTGSALNVVLNLGGNASNAGAVCMLVGSTNKVTAVYNNSYLDSNTILTEGEWYHIVVNFNGTHSQIYINGVFDKNVTRTAADISNVLVKEIGRDSTVARTYKDQIAQPRIYNRALTASEVLNNYNATKTQYQ